MTVCSCRQEEAEENGCTRDVACRLAMYVSLDSLAECMRLIVLLSMRARVHTHTHTRTHTHTHLADHVDVQGVTHR
jgi:hypothetical protein